MISIDYRLSLTHPAFGSYIFILFQWTFHHHSSNVPLERHHHHLSLTGYGCLYILAHKNRLDDLVYEIRLVEEIQHQLIGSLSHRFYTSHMVVWDFFHQQHLLKAQDFEIFTHTHTHSCFPCLTWVNCNRFTRWKIQLTLPETDSLHPKNGWFPIGTSFSRGLFSGAMLISGKVCFDVVSDHVTIFSSHVNLRCTLYIYRSIIPIALVDQETEQVFVLPRRLFLIHHVGVSQDPKCLKYTGKNSM